MPFCRSTNNTEITGVIITRRSKGKRHAQVIKRSKTTVMRQRLARLRVYLSKHYLVLLPITLTCISIGVTIYAIDLDPDIRLVRDAGSQKFFSPPVSEASGGCLYYLSIRPRFKNNSFKGGYINNATFTPLTLDLDPKFDLVEIDKSKLGRGDERDVEAKFKLSLPSDACRKVASREDPFKFAIYFYDNTGKLINQDTAGEYFVFPSEIRFAGVASQIPQHGN
jgi:hypothetical protein